MLKGSSDDALAQSKRSVITNRDSYARAKGVVRTSLVLEAPLAPRAFGHVMLKARALDGINLVVETELSET